MVSPYLKDDLYPSSPDAPGPQLVWSALGFGNAASDWSSLSTVNINGVDFTVDNNVNWSTFGPDSSGRLQWATASGNTYGNGNFNSPILRASLADLLGETPSVDGHPLVQPLRRHRWKRGVLGLGVGRSDSVHVPHR